jgi:hypothetical protein
MKQQRVVDTLYREAGAIQRGSGEVPRELPHLAIDRADIRRCSVPERPPSRGG